MITTEDAAKALGVSVRRVQQLVKDGTLQGEWFSGVYAIHEPSLEIAKTRKTKRGRKKGDPWKKQKSSAT